MPKLDRTAVVLIVAIWLTLAMAMIIRAFQ